LNKNKYTHPFNYPDKEGKVCRCHDDRRTDCMATCASNVVDYDVVSQYGKSVALAQCTGSSVVLGCGMQPAYGDDTEEVLNMEDIDDERLSKIENEEPRFTAWAVKDSTKCECYDDLGITCYAICGRLTY